MGEVIIIPATKGKASDQFIHKQLRVCSYSRVSTNFEEQLTSFHSQKIYYTDMIMRNPKWTLAGTFADEGISGASATKRPEFMKMIRKCNNGKIDLIITKSISRFARNTIDSIKYCRKLKLMGIGVLFEKENINTLDENSEVLLTILASLAQEELNSLSLNVKMGKRMAMKEGKVYWNYSKIYGFKEGENGQPVINEKHAEIIKKIYAWYLEGKSEKGIIDNLTERNIKSISKNGEWKIHIIQSILKNERMCGDVILQKTYVVDPISKKVKENNGELPKIFIKNNHPAIIDRATYEKAQLERSKRTSKRKTSFKTKTEQGKYSSMYALNDILRCAECGSPYRRALWTHYARGTHDKTRRAVWRCLNRLDNGKKYCKNSPTLDEVKLQKVIMKAIKVTAKDRKRLIPILVMEIENSLWSQVDGTINVSKVEEQIATLKSQTMKLIAECTATHTIAEQHDVLKTMSDEIRELQTMLDQYKESGTVEDKIHKEVEEVKTFLENDTNDYEDYDDDIIRQVIRQIKVHDDGKLQILFNCGMEYETKIN
ncbi:MAG: recombinase family protein [Clostridia bacterium]